MKKKFVLFSLFFALLGSCAGADSFDVFKSDLQLQKFQQADYLVFGQPFSDNQMSTEGFDFVGSVEKGFQTNLYLPNDNAKGFYGVKRNRFNPLELFHMHVLAKNRELKEILLRFKTTKNYNILVQRLSQQLGKPQNSIETVVNNSETIQSMEWGISYEKDNNIKNKLFMPIVFLNYWPKTQQGELKWLDPKDQIEHITHNHNE